jgi:hypothetical protein
MRDYLKKQNLLPQFVTFAESKVKSNAAALKRSGSSIENLIMAYIMRQSGYENYFYQMFNEKDPTYNKGLEILREGKAWPFQE